RGERDRYGRGGSECRGRPPPPSRPAEQVVVEAGRGVDRPQVAEQAPDASGAVELARARRAPLDVRPHGGRLAGPELAVEEGAQRVTRVLAVHASARRRRPRPRWMRLRTVPTGTPIT